MTYGQLAKFIEMMTNEQKAMPVIVAVANDFLEMGMMLNVKHNDDVEGMPEGQPVLT